MAGEDRALEWEEPSDLITDMDLTALVVKCRRGAVPVTGETELANFFVMQRLFNAFCAERKRVGALIDGPTFQVPEHSQFESQQLIGRDAWWVSGGHNAPRQMLDTIFLHQISDAESAECCWDVSYSIKRVVASVPRPAANAFAYLDTLRPGYEGTLSTRLRQCMSFWIDVDRYARARYVDFDRSEQIA